MIGRRLPRQFGALRQAFHGDELAVAIGPALTDAQSRAVKLLADVPKPQPEGRTTPGTTVTQETPRPGGGAQPGGDGSPKRSNKYAHLDSDEAEVADFYKSDAKALRETANSWSS